MNNQRFKKLAVLTLAAFGWVVSNAASFQPCQAAPKTVWQLEQYSDNLGDCQVFVFHDGVKVVCKKLKCEVLTAAPDWKVHCYRSDEKIEWVDDLSNFGGDSMSNPFARIRKIRQIKLSEIGTGSLKGLNYTKYKTKVSDKDLLYLANEIDVAPEIGDFLSRLYVTPISSKIPIYRCLDRSKDAKLPETKIGIINVGANGDLRTGLIDKLKTTGWKKIAYSSPAFKAPSGYKRAKELYQATYSQSKKGEFSEIFDEIGYKSDARALKNGARTK
ncbi:MAG: hypothetical protein WC714_10905 [Candidatus Obscuribacterales bacterium]|jgi:hypothetical protein